MSGSFNPIDFYEWEEEAYMYVALIRSNKQY